MNKYIILGLVAILIVSSIFFLEALKPEKFDTPELQGISGYLNGAPEGLQISDLKGKVVLIDFWTYSCVNCIRTLPYLTEWHNRYNDSGLVIIGVHTPEFTFEKEEENVQAAIEKYGIEYWVVQDNDYATWRAFENRYWPRKYLIDTKGNIRYDHIGEGGYQETEQMIQLLLKEAGTQVNIEFIEEQESGRNPRTPELYAGYQFAIPRNQQLGQGFYPDKTRNYISPEQILPDTIYLEGSWTSDPEKLIAESPAKIILKFSGTEANIVGEGGEITIFIDGEQTQTITALNPDLYNVYEGNFTQSLLIIEVEPGFSFHAFTFG